MSGSPHGSTLATPGSADLVEATTAPLLASHLLAIALGGAIGAVLRHLVNHMGSRVSPDHPERATLLINAAGSLLLGGLLAWTLARPEHLPPALQAGLVVGLLGAFTTYSTFSVDALKMLQAGRVFDAVVYVVATTVVCIALAAAGYGVVWLVLGKPGV
jgi:fluoride exporter